MIESFVVLTITREDVANVTGDKKKAADLSDQQMQHIANKFEAVLMELYWDVLKKVIKEVQDASLCEDE